MTGSIKKIIKIVTMPIPKTRQMDRAITYIFLILETNARVRYKLRSIASPRKKEFRSAIETNFNAASGKT